MPTSLQDLIVNLRKTVKDLSRKNLPHSHVVVEAFKAVEKSLHDLFPRCPQPPSQKQTFFGYLIELKEKGRIPKRLFHDILGLKDRRDSGGAHHGPRLREYDALFARATLLHFLTWIGDQLPTNSFVPSSKPRLRHARGLPVYRELMDLVAQSPNTCDDCLSNETEIKPRQRIRYYLRRLMEEGIVERIEAGCTTCGREKIVTFILDMLGAED